MSWTAQSDSRVDHPRNCLQYGKLTLLGPERSTPKERLSHICNNKNTLLIPMLGWYLVTCKESCKLLLSGVRGSSLLFFRNLIWSQSFCCSLACLRLPKEVFPTYIALEKKRPGESHQFQELSEVILSCLTSILSSLPWKRNIWISRKLIQYSALNKYRNLCVYFRFLLLIGVLVIEVFYHNILNLFGICCNVSLFISNSGNLGSLFLLTSWIKGLVILFIFSKKKTKNKIH